MQRSRFATLRSVLALALGLAAACAQAQTVYDNGAPDHASGNNMGFAFQAEAFHLASGDTIGTIEFWSLEAASTYRNQISFQIRADDGGAPGNVLMLQGTTALVDRAAMGSYLGLTEFRNTFALSAQLALAPGDYWLVLHNGGLADVGDPNEFLWETTAGAGGQMGGYEAFSADGPFTRNFQEHAFMISAVPEPGPGLSLLAGLAVLAGVSRRAGSRTFKQQ